MKIIHTADLHLDSALKTYYDSEKSNQRNRELLETFRRMIDYAKENGIKAILIAGDMFDKGKAKKSTENMVYSAIKDNPDIIFFYLKGNHDADSFIANLSEIPSNLKLFGNEWKSYNLSDSVVVTGAELLSDNSSSLFNSILLDNTKINIVMLHGQENQYSSKDKTEIIPLAALKNKGIDYLALGHIHSYKEDILDSRGVYCYPGCLEGRGFDECGQHGFVLLDINEDNGNISRSFIPFAFRNIYELLVDVSGAMSTPDCENAINLAIEQSDFPESSIVKVLLTGQVEIESERDVNLLQSICRQNYYYFKVKDKTEIKINYASFEFDQSLKGEFVRMVQADNELSDLEKALIIKQGISALKGEKIAE